MTKWKRFENDWPALLDKHGIATPFHMTDFMARAKARTQYTGWDGDQDAFIIEAGKLIKKHTQKPFASGVVLPAFRRMHKEFVLPLEEPREPLVWCGERAFSRLLAWVHTRHKAGHVKRTDKLEILVEGGDQDRGKFNKRMDEKFGLEALFVANKDKRIVPFAAADFLAWLLRSWSEKRTTGYYLRDNADRWVWPIARQRDLLIALGKLKPDETLHQLVRLLPAESLFYSDWPKLEQYGIDHGYPRRAAQ